MEKVSYFSFVVENVEFTIYLEDSEFAVRHLWKLSPSHLHPMNELYIMISGKNLITGDFKSIEVSDNDVLIIPPLTYHSAAAVSEEFPLKIAVRFTYRKLDKVNSSIDLYTMLKPLSVINSSPIKLKLDNVMISNLIDATNKNNPVMAVASTPMQKIKMKNIFSLLFICIAEQLEGTKIASDMIVKQYNKEPDYYASLVNLDRMIFRHVNGSISFEDMAEEFHVCKKQLTHIVKNEYLNTAKYLTYEFRIREAASFLLHFPNMPVYEIAERVGYASSEILSIMFKKYYGMSTGEYKKRFSKKLN